MHSGLHIDFDHKNVINLKRGPNEVKTVKKRVINYLTLFNRWMDDDHDDEVWNGNGFKMLNGQ